MGLTHWFNLHDFSNYRSSNYMIFTELKKTFPTILDTKNINKFQIKKTTRNLE